MTTLLFIFLSIVTGILALVSVIFTIISFANSGKSKFTWLTIFIVAFLSMCFCVYSAASRAAKGTKDFVAKMSIPYGYNDSLAYQYLNLADSVNSTQIKYLRQIEPEQFTDKVPAQFYHYLGYRDYYRLR